MLMTYEGIYPQFSGCVLRTCLQKRIRRTHTPTDLRRIWGTVCLRASLVIGYDNTGVWCCASLCVRPCSCFFAGNQVQTRIILSVILEKNILTTPVCLSTALPQHAKKLHHFTVWFISTRT